jgi:hypothetical protein
MGAANFQQTFGPASGCTSLPEVLDVITNHPASSDIRRRAAAFAMLLSARQAVGQGKSFHAARAVLDTLARAKAEIDIAAWHSREVVAVTSGILQAAQHYLDENTIPCTEWPLPAEVAGIVEQEARRLAHG